MARFGVVDAVYARSDRLTDVSMIETMRVEKSQSEKDQEKEDAEIKRLLDMYKEGL